MWLKGLLALWLACGFLLVSLSYALHPFVSSALIFCIFCIRPHACLLQIRELHVAKERAVRAEVCVCVLLVPRYVPSTWGCMGAMHGVSGGMYGVVCVESLPSVVPVVARQ